LLVIFNNRFIKFNKSLSLEVLISKTTLNIILSFLLLEIVINLPLPSIYPDNQYIEREDLIDSILLFSLKYEIAGELISLGPNKDVFNNFSIALFFCIVVKLLFSRIHQTSLNLR